MLDALCFKAAIEVLSERVEYLEACLDMQHQLNVSQIEALEAMHAYVVALEDKIDER